MTVRTLVTSIFGSCLAALVLGFAYFQFVLKPNATRAYLESRPVPITTVSVATAKSVSWQDRLSFPGDIKAQRDVVISAQSNGRIIQVGFANGSFVKQGDLLFAIDVSVENAQRQGHLVALNEAQLELDRQSTLAKHQVATKAALDQAITTRDEASAKLAQINALIAQKTIQAPFDGWAAITQVQPGDFVTAGSQLVTLHKRDQVFVEFSVPEHQLAKVALGAKVELRVHARKTQTFTGSIATLSGRLDPLTRSMKVRAAVSNPHDHLLPGMSAIITVLSDKPRPVVTVPRTAVVYGINGAALIIAKPDPETKTKPAALIVERRAITLSHTDNNSVIIATGIKPGELVVTSGQNKLKPGSLIHADRSKSVAHSSAPMPRQE